MSQFRPLYSPDKLFLELSLGYEVTYSGNLPFISLFSESLIVNVIFQDLFQYANLLRRRDDRNVKCGILRDGPRSRQYVDYYPARVTCDCHDTTGMRPKLFFFKQCEKSYLSLVDARLLAV